LLGGLSGLRGERRLPSHTDDATVVAREQLDRAQTLVLTDAELNARFENLQTTIEASLKAEGLVTRRHFDVVAAGLRTEIRIIAEVTMCCASGRTN
jgi:hypothetical protein